MPRTGGEITKAKILEEAEKLFSEKGYDAASIGAISKAAGINKATIYYHFKDKQEIIQSLFSNIVIELKHQLQTKTKNETAIVDKIKAQINFLRSKRQIISIMLMESLKQGVENNFLFKTMNEVIKKDILEVFPEKKDLDKEKRDQFYVHEFFTGLMPILSFIVFEDNWSDFYDVKKDKTFKYFIDSFQASHIKSHIS